MNGGVKVNKTELKKQYGCCWETIDRRLQPQKYKKEKIKKIYHSMLDDYKNLIAKKLKEHNVPATVSISC